MSPLHTVLKFKQPTLEEHRGEAVLLVWGELAEWMVIDKELHNFLYLFDGRRTVDQIIKQHTQNTNRPASEVRNEGMAMVNELSPKGILAQQWEKDLVPPESVRLANITINITNSCNLRCTWCYNAERFQQMLPIKKMIIAIEDTREILAENASLIILGGEPTIALDRLLLMVEWGNAFFKPPILVSTNGTLLTEKTVAQLAVHRLDVQVSIDSYKAEKHDAIRGKGVFAKAIAGVSRLVHAGIHTTLSMVYSAASIEDFEPYLDLAKNLGVQEVRFIPLRLIGRGSACRKVCPNQAQAFHHLMDILQRRPDLRPLLVRDYFSIIMTLCRFSMLRTGCGIGRKVIFIDADGQVYPCPNHVSPLHKCGSLAEKSLKDIVMSSAMMQQIRGQYQVANYPQCQSCPFCYWCAGDCRGEVLSVTHDPFAPSPHCEELKQVMKEMMWLIAEGNDHLGTAAKLRHGQKIGDLYQV